MSGFRAVILDLDGTLVDSLADLGESMNFVLEKHGFPVHTIVAYAGFVGDGIRNLVLRSLPDGSDEAVVSACVSELRSVYAECWHVRTRPYAGMQPALVAFRSLRLKTAVLTNKPHGVALQVVSHFFDRSSFDEILGAECGFARKPDPAGALELARRLAVTPQECLYVGDTATDMRTAVAANMVGVGALWGFRGAAELEAAGAVHLIDRPSDIVKLLDGPAAEGPAAG